MYKSTIILILIAFISPIFAENYIVQTFRDRDGKLIDKITVPGIPVDKRIPGHIAHPTRSAVMLSGVPAFDWSYGCSATSAAMMAGYYDRLNFGHLYTGPTNGGLMPLNNSTWGSGECPLSATHQGIDGQITAGHVDRFWTNSTGSDPYGTSDPTGTYFGCTADYMGTNQDWWGNSDGSTTFYNYVDGSALHDPADGTSGPPYGRDGIHGLKLFFESRGYSVSTNYNQYIYGWQGNTIGYTYEQYKSSINAGIPVMIQIEGHSMVGIGYETTSSTIYILNTWDYDIHTMTWGGIYSGMAHYGVSVISLNPPPSIQLSKTSVSALLQPEQQGTDSFTISNTGQGPLTYHLNMTEIRQAENNNTTSLKEQDERSIAGSTLSADITEYEPGTTLNWTLTVHNASTDDEWLKHVYVTFPVGVYVNSATNFVGGGGGEMAPSPSSGNGVTIDWFGESGGWGVVYSGQDAVATVNVTIGTSFTGNLALPYQINGDVYGAEPHIVTSSITIPQAIPDVSWFNPMPISSIVPAGSSQTITCHFDATGLAAGTYQATMTVQSNDPYGPARIMNVTMTVMGSNFVPSVSSIINQTGGMRITWEPVTGATQYKVYRALTPSGPFNYLGSTTNNWYQDSSAQGRAFYRVTSIY